MKRAKVSQALFAKVAANKSQVSGKGAFLGGLFLKQTPGLELDPSPLPTSKNTSVPTIIIFISAEPVVFLAFACSSGFLFPFRTGRASAHSQASSPLLYKHACFLLLLIYNSHLC